MTVVIKQATLNIYAIKNRTRLGMLTEYIGRHGLDIVFLLEITDSKLLPKHGYDIYCNIESDMRGTPIVARNDIVLKYINKLTSGRAIATECKALYIVIVYAPSGKAKRTEREYFYNAEVPQLLQSGHGEIIRANSTVSLTQLTHPAISILAGPSPRYVGFKRGSKIRPDQHIHITLTHTPAALTDYTYLTI
jgi:hypothetical protein